MDRARCACAKPNGQGGRIKRSKAANLIGRLRDYSDNVWRFMTDPNVPFTNNLAEQVVRMPKAKRFAQYFEPCTLSSTSADVCTSKKDRLAKTPRSSNW
ncbi:IS66 family transposase [Verminephrobacter aporrectodeae]|uniref:IS66 family transposase n=1 Tax=Verminephrobacter aporrectodeae TaxID=1110389 RepID=UPI00389A62D2|nr:hypothetical protein [Verminephrobacter aporrectodeae subsp. tuberculatae]